MTDLNLKISDKCIHCGKCISDCMPKVLEFDENKIPRVAENAAERCMKCQHCLAVCPVGALSILDKEPQNSAPYLKGKPEDLLNLIQTRRSCRHYKKENLPIETLNKLKDMLKYVPTGVNNHNLHFSFIEDVEVMDDFRNYTNNKIIEMVQKQPLSALTKKYGYMKESLLNGEDLIFRGAPHLVVVSSPLNAPCRDIDPVIALSYFELYARSMDVATTWCGLGYGCLRLIPELCKQLEIPDNYKVSYMMLFGPRDIEYQRGVQPEPYKMVTVKKDNRQMSFVEKTKRFLLNNVM